MTGAGNTFLVTDARDAYHTELAKKLCKARRADGFMALGPSKKADFRLHFYNADGSRAAMCGNGVRCLCRFAYDNDIAGRHMTVETDSGPVWGQRLGESWYRVRLPDPGEVRRGPVSRVTVGVPHAVVEEPELDFSQREALLPRARQLRRALDANVDFYRRLGKAKARVLTYERGVEGFTAACGTGCVAVAALLGGRLIAENRGGLLAVDGPCLTGSAEILEIFDVTL